MILIRLKGEIRIITKKNFRYELEIFKKMRIFGANSNIFEN
jgi:hypothetical protein